MYIFIRKRYENNGIHISTTSVKWATELIRDAYIFRYVIYCNPVVIPVNVTDGMDS